MSVTAGGRRSRELRAGALLASVLLASVTGACGSRGIVNAADSSNGGEVPTSTTESPTTSMSEASSSTTLAPQPVVGDCGHFPTRGQRPPPSGVSVTTEADTSDKGGAVTFRVIAVNNSSEPVQYIGGGGPHQVDVLLGSRFVFTPNFAMGSVAGGPVRYLQPGERNVLEIVWHRETCNPHGNDDASDRFLPNSAPAGTYRVAGVWFGWEAPEITVVLN
jgi:hypothetical protein